ncbi:MAG: DUF1467 family protein [Parvularcula sp.]
MGIAGSIVSFLIIWWTVLFAVLPMRVKSQWENEKGRPAGTDPGAPIHPHIAFKLKRTTMIAVGIWVVVFMIVSSGIIDFGR